MQTELTCPCGGTYEQVPDEDVSGIPPTLFSRFFYCRDCEGYDWRDPDYFGLDYWEDEEDEDLY